MNRLFSSIRPILPVLCVAALMCGSGCAYRWGSVMHPGIHTVAVGDFENRTQNAELETLLRKKLAEHFTVDGSLRVTTAAEADIVVSGRIASVQMRRIASTKSRDKDSRDRDRDAYQTSIFRTEIQIEFETVSPKRNTVIRSAQSALGVAEFSHLPDLEIARREGLNQAANDAASKVVAAVTEAW